MSEAELLDMVISERITTLLATQQKSNADQKKELQWISQAEEIIHNLPEADCDDHITDQLAFEEPFLYRHGFIDGIRVSKLLDNL